MPAAIAAWRAGAWPRLAGSTQPMITSDDSAAATPDCSSAAAMAVAPRVGVGTPVNWPRKEPMAVRLAAAMTMLPTWAISLMREQVSESGTRMPIGGSGFPGRLRRTGQV